jgi:hypothetical protein
MQESANTVVDDKKITTHNQETHMKRLFSILSILYAQLSFAQVTVFLQQPPMNRLSAKDLWNCTIQNVSAKSVNVTLEGTVTEANEGRIVEGNTKTIRLAPNETKRFNAENIPGGSYSWKNRRCQESIIRTGSPPSGTYTICIFAKDERGTTVGSDCKDQGIQNASPPVLVSPYDGESLASNQQVLFTWMASSPVPADGKYSIRIVEIIGKQNPQEAMRKNQAFFESQDVRRQAFKYPQGARAFTKNKKYAWMVRSGESQSEIFTFKLSTIPVEITSVASACTNIFGVYVFEIRVKNTSTATAQLQKISFFDPTPNTATQVMITLSSYVDGLMVSHPLSGSSCLVQFSQGFGSSCPLQLSMSGGEACVIIGTAAFQDNTGTSVLVDNIGTWVQSETEGRQDLYTRHDDVTPCSCCQDFDFASNLSLFQIPGAAGHHINGTISAGPRNIRKITAHFSYLKVQTNSMNCTGCNSNTLLQGNFVSTQNSIGGHAGVLTLPSGYIPAPAYSRELVWTMAPFGLDMSSGVNINMHLSLPDVYPLACCTDTIQACIRFSFEDTTCVTCERLVCLSFIRPSTSQHHGSLLDESRRTPKDVTPSDQRVAGFSARPVARIVDRSRIEPFSNYSYR